jgi:hypothetical protein
MYRVETLKAAGLMKDEDGDSYDSLYRLAQEFYGHLAASILQGNRNKAMPKIYPIAEKVAAALALSCLGEARYISGCTLNEILMRCPPEKRAAVILGWFKQIHPDKRNTIGSWHIANVEVNAVQPEKGHVSAHLSASRDSAVVPAMPSADMARIAYHVLIMSLRLHNTSHAGYAGAYWTYGAKMAHEYYTGKLSPVLFLDHVFNLVHNGGGILNKVFDYTHLTSFLSFRRTASPETLVATCLDLEEQRYWGLDITPYRWQGQYYPNIQPFNKQLISRALKIKKWLRCTSYNVKGASMYMLNHHTVSPYSAKGMAVARPAMSAKHKNMGKKALHMQQKEKSWKSQSEPTSCPASRSKVLAVVEPQSEAALA